MWNTFNSVEQALGTKQAVIISEKPYNHKGNDRVIIKARKARGKKVFMVVKYEDGTFSSAT